MASLMETVAIFIYGFIFVYAFCLSFTLPQQIEKAWVLSFLGWQSSTKLSYFYFSFLTQATASQRCRRFAYGKCGFGYNDGILYLRI